MSRQLYFKQPRYFSQFSCVGGECPNSCCDGWKITWSKDEIDKIKSADMSDELRKLVDESFEEDTLNDAVRSYQIKLCEDLTCPFHEKESGLCALQKNLGEEYLGNTCSIYPRLYTIKDNVITRSCISSCPEVLRLLMKDSRAMQFELVQIRDNSIVDSFIGYMLLDRGDVYAYAPYIKYRDQITDFYVNLFNSKFGFEDTMVIGAIAAGNIENAVNANRVGSIPAVLADLQKKYRTAAFLDSVAKVQPDYRLKFLLVNSVITILNREGATDAYIYSFIEGRNLYLGNYTEGAEKFAGMFGDRDQMLKNISLNILLEMFMNLMRRNNGADYHGFLGLYSYFTAFAAVLQVYASHTAFTSSDPERDFILICSQVTRGLSHSSGRMKYIIDVINGLEIHTVDQLAGIIK